MGKFILFLDRLVYLYIYFIMGACILSWIPNINPNYPLFNIIFKIAGAGIIPPVLGFDIGPAGIVIILVLISTGLRKLYLRFFKPEEPEVIVLTKDDFEKCLDKYNKMKKEDEDNGN